jgi:hypothetical protein
MDLAALAVGSLSSNQVAYFLASHFTPSVGRRRSWTFCPPELPIRPGRPLRDGCRLRRPHCFQCIGITSRTEHILSRYKDKKLPSHTPGDGDDESAKWLDDHGCPAKTCFAVLNWQNSSMTSGFPAKSCLTALSYSANVVLVNLFNGDLLVTRLYNRLL